MTTPIVLSLGELLWDMLPSGKRAGGAPVNFAYHAKMNGADGWSISAVGEDELGDELIAKADEAGINTVLQRNAWPTSTVEVALKNGIPEYTIVKGVAWDHILYTRQLIDIVEQADAVCFGTLAQRCEVSHRTTCAMVEAVPAEAYRIYDINLRQHFYSKELIDRSLRMANVLKINDDELVRLQKMFALPEDTDVACRKLAEQYALRMVVLTGGDRFSSIYTSDRTSVLPTPRVKVVDTVGAGDAFSGSLIGALLTGRTIEEAHRTAVETAAYVCTCAGAWPPPRK